MKTHTKLLAEKYLYKTASRFFDEDDTAEQLSEKLVHAKLPDGRYVEVDDEDYESFDDVSPKVAYGKDEEPVEGDIAQGPLRPAKYTGKHSKQASNDKAATNYLARAERGKAEYEKLLPEINEIIDEFVKKAIDRRVITYDDVLEQWEIGSSEKARKTIFDTLTRLVRDRVIHPAKAQMTSARDRDALDAAFNVAFVNPYFTSKIAELKDKPFSGINRYIKLAVKRLNATNESLQSMFVSACNKALTEMYAKRYKVRLNEANKMFILNDKIFG